MMTSPSQEIFDHAETIGDAIDNIAGCEDALFALLEAPLADQPDKGRSVYALLVSLRAFAREAAQAADRVARLAGQVTP